VRRTRLRAMRFLIEAAIRGEPIVMNGPLIDDLFARVTGDAAALAKIRSMLPVDDPATMRIEHRRAVLRAIRDDLVTGHPELSDHYIAKLLFKAGEWCLSRQDSLPIDRAPFNRLDRAELVPLERNMRELLQVLEITSGSWLSFVAVRKLLDAKC
jgi:hypothetical protein